jgi:phosphoribosyl-AMP cyclohydrolase
LRSAASLSAPRDGATGQLARLRVYFSPYSAVLSGRSCTPLFMGTTIVNESTGQGPDFSKCGGMLPAIAQDAETGDVLMLAYMNAESFAKTLEIGQAVYFSRSRNKLWHKGEESGNVQHVQAIFVDCDADTILLKVKQAGGAACHEGYRSCFFRQVTPAGLETQGERVFDPKEVYGK